MAVQLPTKRLKFVPKPQRKNMMRFQISDIERGLILFLSAQLLSSTGENLKPRMLNCYDGGEETKNGSPWHARCNLGGLGSHWIVCDLVTGSLELPKVAQNLLP